MGRSCRTHGGWLTWGKYMGEYTHTHNNNEMGYIRLLEHRFSKKKMCKVSI